MGLQMLGILFNLSPLAAKQPGHDFLSSHGSSSVRVLQSSRLRTKLFLEHSARSVKMILACWFGVRLDVENGEMVKGGGGGRNVC